MAVAWTIGRIFQRRQRFEDNSLHVYAPYPFYFDFQDTVEAAGVYNGSHRSFEQFLPDLLHGVDGKHFDMVVLGTCEVDLRPPAHEELLAAWHALDEEHKFKLVCIVHDATDDFWFPSTREWVRLGALRLLPISQQCVMHQPQLS
ncbi:hypothetical protein CPB85DRAFT_1017215 [Mucidula mucida]|nr:hypothetical protein CPB85DRAFT_1017215 [Mucidula mucida]